MIDPHMQFSGNRDLRMSLHDWYRYWLRPEELLFNTSAIDGSDFHQPCPLGISVFLAEGVPGDDRLFCPLAQHPSKVKYWANAIFSTNTTNKVGNQRIRASRQLKGKEGFIFQHMKSTKRRLTPAKTIEWYRRTPFTISPRGNGIDCHRNYEALIYKSVPIICDADESMREKYKKLPVVFVDTYADLTPEFLRHLLDGMLHKIYDFNYLTRSYWEYRRPDLNILMQSVYWLKRFGKFEHVHGYFHKRDEETISRINPRPYPHPPGTLFVPNPLWDVD